MGKRFGAVWLSALTLAAVSLSPGVGEPAQGAAGKEIGRLGVRRSDVAFKEADAGPGFRYSTSRGWWFDSLLIGRSHRVLSSSRNRARYVSADGAYSLNLEASPWGIKEEIIISSRSAPASYDFAVDWASGLQLRTAMGGIVFAYPGEGDVFYVPPPKAWDAAGRFVPITFTRAEHIWNFAIDPAFLAVAPLPLTIDPSIIDTSVQVGDDVASRRSVVQANDGTMIVGYQDGSTLEVSSALPPDYTTWSTFAIFMSVRSFSLAMDHDDVLHVVYEAGLSTPRPVSLQRFARNNLGQWLSTGDPIQLASNGRFPSVTPTTTNEIWVSWEERVTLPLSIKLMAARVSPSPLATTVADLTAAGGAQPGFSSLVPTTEGLGIAYNDTANGLRWRWTPLPFESWSAPVDLEGVSGSHFSAGADGERVRIAATRLLEPNCGVYISDLNKTTVIAGPYALGEDGLDCSLPDVLGGPSLTAGLEENAWVFFTRRVGDRQRQLRFAPITSRTARAPGAWLSEEAAFGGVFTGGAVLENKTAQAWSVDPNDVLFAQANGDRLYFGLEDPFGYARVTMGIGASDSILPQFEYSTESGWNGLTVSDGTGGFRQIGTLTWSPPSDWATQEVNGVRAYWLRVTRTVGFLLTAPVATQLTPVRDNHIPTSLQNGYEGAPGLVWVDASDDPAVLKFDHTTANTRLLCSADFSVQLTNLKSGRAIAVQNVETADNGSDQIFQNWVSTQTVTYTWRRYYSALRTGYDWELIANGLATSAAGTPEECDLPPDAKSIKIQSVSGESYTLNSLNALFIPGGTYSYRVAAKGSTGYVSQASWSDQIVSVAQWFKWSGIDNKLTCGSLSSWPGQWNQILNNSLSAWHNTGSKLLIARTLFVSSAPCQVAYSDLGANSFLGLATKFYYTDPDNPFHVKVELNSAKPWSTSGDPLRYDVMSVLLHELGHATGVAHDQRYRQSVLFPLFSTGERRQTLIAYDRNSIRAIYGAR